MPTCKAKNTSCLTTVLCLGICKFRKVVTQCNIDDSDMQLGSIIKWFNDTIPNNNIKRPVRVNAQVIQYANPEGNSNWYLGRVIHCISNKINQWLTLLNWQMVRICNEIKHSFAFYIMWIGIWNDIHGSCSKLWRGCPLVAWQWIVHDRRDNQLIW